MNSLPVGSRKHLYLKCSRNSSNFIQLCVRDIALISNAHGKLFFYIFKYKVEIYMKKNLLFLSFVGALTCTSGLSAYPSKKSAFSQINNTFFLNACKKGYASKVKAFLDRGWLVERGNGYGETGLILAAAKGHFSIVCLLYEYGANLNKRDHSNNRHTALIAAAGNGHLSVVQYLIYVGADLEKTDVDGMTALMVAAENGYYTIVQTLLLSGTCPDCLSDEGMTALDYADDNNYLILADLL